MAQPRPWDNPRRPGPHRFPPRLAKRILAAASDCALQLPGCSHQPTEVDHIVGWADALARGWDPEDIDDPTNAQPVCRSCHAIKTRAEQQRGRQRQADARRTTAGRQRAPEQHPAMRHHLAWPQGGG